MIYTPKGRAREFADLALNIYKGCTHSCKYCFNAGSPWAKQYFKSANPKKNIIARLRRDCTKLALSGSASEILISFVGDPYQPAELGLGITRRVIQTLIEFDLPFTILTKGGLRACRDFDLLQPYPKARFGVSLVFWDQQQADRWEPNAAPIAERVTSLALAHARGIPTWVSLEPVIDPEEAIKVVRNLHEWVGHWKIGNINHFPKLESRVDWYTFRQHITDLLDDLGADYYLKKSLTTICGGGLHAGI